MGTMCDKDPANYPDSMPKFNPPGQIPDNPTPSIHRVTKGVGPEFRWHKEGFKYPYKQRIDGGGYCITCHGKDLEGSDLGWSKPPSCYTCHDQKWNDDGKDLLPPEIGDPPPSHDPRYSYGTSAYPYDYAFIDGISVPKFNPPLSIHTTPKPPPLDGEASPELGNQDYRWHKSGFYIAEEPCGPAWTCKCCHGPDDITGTFIEAITGERKIIEYFDPIDGKTKNPPSCYTCHNRTWLN